MQTSSVAVKSVVITFHCKHNYVKNLVIFWRQFFQDLQNIHTLPSSGKSEK